MIPVGLLLKVKSLLNSIPWQLYVAAALIVTIPIARCHWIGVGEDRVYDKLEKAEADAKAKAMEAAASSDKQSQDRANEFKAQQEALNKVIEEAKANDENPLDAIF